ncbi:MAG TPA: UDP-3-O-(3-hydroxymyristoyl)glucosamine N-acyltransferase [Methylococcales bacterium]|nr:UDP-3-O-(3-hydroxymyristoyl)glucosamine N-acyltransferase [Methylococcales bacterium]
MTSTLGQLADSINAQLINGNSAQPIHGVATLAAAQQGEISFLTNFKHLPNALQSQASAIIVGRVIADLEIPQLVSENPYLSWAKTVALFKADRSSHLPLSIHPSACIDPSCQISDNTHIGANVVIGANSTVGSDCKIHSGVVIEENCQLGNNVEIHPNVVIHFGSQIGNRCNIWSNAVIGSYGFGNAKDGAQFVRIHQLGNAILEDDVDIGAGATIDRGAVDNTVIKRGAKIDNLVMIAHNVIIGEDTAIAAQTGISGSTKIGNQVLIAGQVGFVGHIEIGDQSFVGAQAGVSKSFPAGSKITGYPARNLMDVRRSDTAITHLPKLIKKVKLLEQKISALTNKA